MSRPIFVFGSNEAGIHGAGAAKFAYNERGAIYGQGEGMQGESYAIPTKDRQIRSLPLFIIERYVEHFLDFATKNPELTFQVTPIGCGLAGFTPEQIAPFFKDAPPNCILPAEFGGPSEPWKG